MPSHLATSSIDGDSRAQYAANTAMSKRWAKSSHRMRVEPDKSKRDAISCRHADASDDESDSDVVVARCLKQT